MKRNIILLSIILVLASCNTNKTNNNNNDNTQKEMNYKIIDDSNALDSLKSYSFNSLGL